MTLAPPATSRLRSSNQCPYHRQNPPKQSVTPAVDWTIACFAITRQRRRLCLPTTRGAPMTLVPPVTSRLLFPSRCRYRRENRPQRYLTAPAGWAIACYATARERSRRCRLNIPGALMKHAPLAIRNLARLHRFRPEGYQWHRQYRMALLDFPIAHRATGQASGHSQVTTVDVLVVGAASATKQQVCRRRQQAIPRR